MKVGTRMKVQMWMVRGYDSELSSDVGRGLLRYRVDLPILSTPYGDLIEKKTCEACRL